MSFDPFVNIDDLYVYLRLPPLGAGTDPLATIALDSACNAVRDFLNLSINVVTDDTIIIDTDGSDRLMLPEAPVIALSGLSTLTTSTDFTTTAYDINTYVVDTEAGLVIFRGSFFPDRNAAVQLTYTHGFTNVPAGIRIVALTLAARIYDQGLAKAETIGNTRLVYSHDESLGLSDREKSAIVKYRRLGVPRHYGVTT